jgi:long-chain acyl-CoA synthetase
MDGFDGRIEVEGCDTIPKLFWPQVKARDQRPAFREKKLGLWREWTWAQAGEAVREIGAGLLAIGLAPGDCASIPAGTPHSYAFEARVNRVIVVNAPA